MGLPTSLTRNFDKETGRVGGSLIDGFVIPGWKYWESPYCSDTLEKPMKFLSDDFSN